MNRPMKFVLLVGIFLINRKADGCLNLNVFQNQIITTKERINGAGFTSEECKVRTRDGYVLKVFRIGVNKNIPGYDVFTNVFGNVNLNFGFPVLLMHDLLSSSDQYLLDNNSLVGDVYLAIALAKAGYDVWLGNVRGNAYSREHMVFSPDDIQFWDFSWHEMGVYDLPATIDYVLMRTNRLQLQYIGHSMGTTSFFVMTSVLPTYNRRIRTMVALAPAVRFTKFSNIFYTDSFLYKIIMDAVDNYESRGKVETLPRRDFVGQSNYQLDCEDIFIPASLFCCLFVQDLRNSGGGLSVPAGTSLKTIRHYLQNAAARSFQRFDYGTQELNRRKWSDSKPREYDLSRVTTPVAIFYTPSDALISAEDAEYLVTSLPNVIKVWKAPDYYTHMDFMATSNPLSALTKATMTDELITLLHTRSLFP